MGIVGSRLPTEPRIAKGEEGKLGKSSTVHGYEARFPHRRKRARVRKQKKR